MKTKKAQVGINAILPLGILFVVIAIAMGLGAQVLGEIQDDQVTNTAGCNSTVTSLCGYDYNSSVNGLEAIDELSGWLPTIGLVVAAAIIIGVVITFLARGNM